MIPPAAPATLRSLTPPVTFSIAVPIRDHVEYLDSALRSLEAQDVDRHVAALDASADDRAQQILSGRRVPVAYGYHRADRGQAAAIQEGWNHTNGDVVAWLNADDFYFPHALDRVAAVFDARPDVDVVYGHAVLASAGGDFLAYFPAIDPDPRSLTRGCTICQPSCFVRRRAIERIGGLDTALHYTMDWDLWLRLHRAGCRFEFLDAPLSVVRVHPATKTMSRAPDRYREIAALLKRAGAPYFSRMRTLRGFYTYDLQHRRASVTDRVLYELLSLTSRAQYLVRTRTARVIHGIECWTNLVRGDCRVDFPWFGEGTTADVTVISDRPIDLSYSSAKGHGALEPNGRADAEYRGRTLRGHRYSGPVPVNGRALSVDLRAGQSPWRLLRVSAA